MGRYIIIFEKEEDTKILEQYKAKDIEVHMGVIAIATLDSEEAKELSKKPEVESVEEDFNEHLDMEEDSGDIRYEKSTTTYAFDFMNIANFHKEGITGKGFKIAILDTGIQKHVNLKIKEGINAYDSSQPWNENLANAHGTRVAGIINAQGLNEEVIGIAPDAEIYCARIDNGNGAINTTTWSSQIAGIAWAVEKGVDAVNCSFSSRIDSKARKKAFKIASDKGIAIFCSAGNNQPRTDTTSNTSRYPAKYPFTIANANINPDKTRYPTSCIGQGLNFSNGGVKAYSTTTNTKFIGTSDRHIVGTGTSFASPATLAIYILYKQKYQEPKEKILQRMAVNAERLGDTFWYGAGLPKYPTKEYVNVRVRG